MGSSQHVKLKSLQGLRGIAILLVLIFHLFPKKFTNGFVGVDMFFVLSGYLMTRILTSKGISVGSVVEFYKKRFSRILPLYYLTVLATILGVLTLVLRSERVEFIYDVIWCLPLVSNMQPIFEHHTYWEQVSSIRYLTHLWSLCTELQYYLMAPLIHFIASMLSFEWRLCSYSVAIAILYTFQVLTPFELSYSFLASRVWQFLLGGVAFELSAYMKETSEYKIETPTKKYTFESTIPYIFIAVIFFLMVLPSEEVPARTLMSIGATLICYYAGSPTLEESFFSVKPLVFLGNISYVVYLVHWPIINFIRYIQQRDLTGLSIPEALIALVLIFALSLLVHYTIEKKIITVDFTINFIAAFFLFSICYSLIPYLHSQQCFAMSTISPDLQDKLEFNMNPSKLWINVSDLPCEFNEHTANLSIDQANVEYCSHKGNGSGTVLVVGNSIAMRSFPLIFKLLDGRYKEVRLFARHGSAPLLNQVPEYTEAVRKMAEEMHPEMLWIIQGMNEILWGSKATDGFSSATLNRTVPETIDKLKGLADIVYIDLPCFLIMAYPSKLIARSLIFRKNPEDTLSFSLEEVEEQIGEQSHRLIKANCENCYYNDVQKALTNGSSRFQFFEKETYRVLSNDGSHNTLTAFNYIKPVYQQAVDHFLRVIRNKS